MFIINIILVPTFTLAVVWTSSALPNTIFFTLMCLGKNAEFFYFCVIHFLNIIIISILNININFFDDNMYIYKHN